MQIRPFQDSDESAVIELWHKCNLVRPVNNPKKDIQRKLAASPQLFLVGLLDGEVIASVMAGHEGHRGWINYLAVDPQHRLNGYGKQIMAEAEKLLRAIGCPKINLQVRTSNQDVLAFYQSIGYVVDEVVSLGKRLERDEEKL